MEHLEYTAGHEEVEAGQPKTSLKRNIIHPQTVMKRLGIKSRATIWNRVRAGSLPAPVDVGGGQIGFYEDEIDDLIDNLPRVSYAPTEAA